MERRHGSRKNKKEKKLTTPIILRPSLRNSSEIGRLPREVNNKNTYEDGDYLMVSLVDGEGQQPQSSSGPMVTGGYGEIVPPPPRIRVLT